MNIDSISGLGGAGSPDTVLSTRGAQFGENPFLQLLVAQMRSQTPMEPVDNAAFMEQLASFSSMEEQRQLNENMLALLDYQGVLARLQGLSEGSALLGKEVEWVGEGGTEKSGVVDSVYVTEQGGVRLRVGDEDVALGSITSIRQNGGGSSGDNGDDGAGA